MFILTCCRYSWVLLKHFVHVLFLGCICVSACMSVVNVKGEKLCCWPEWAKIGEHDGIIKHTHWRHTWRTLNKNKNEDKNKTLFIYIFRIYKRAINYLNDAVYTTNSAELIAEFFSCKLTQYPFFWCFNFILYVTNLVADFLVKIAKWLASSKNTKLTHGHTSQAKSIITACRRFRIPCHRF